MPNTSSATMSIVANTGRLILTSLKNMGYGVRGTGLNHPR
jgi:hypothetical protein